MCARSVKSLDVHQLCEKFFSVTCWWKVTDLQRGNKWIYQNLYFAQPCFVRLLSTWPLNYFLERGKMKTMKTKLVIALILTGLLIVALIALTACKKKSEPAPSEQIEEIAAELKAVEQTICPVMKGPINKDIFTEYEGKKVYFCCDACKQKFEEEPEEYLAELPQFKQ